MFRRQEESSRPAEQNEQEEEGEAGVSTGTSQLGNTSSSQLEPPTHSLDLQDWYLLLMQEALIMSPIDQKTVKQEQQHTDTNIYQPPVLSNESTEAWPSHQGGDVLTKTESGNLLQELYWNISSPTFEQQLQTHTPDLQDIGAFKNDFQANLAEEFNQLTTELAPEDTSIPEIPTSLGFENFAPSEAFLKSMPGSDMEPAAELEASSSAVVPGSLDSIVRPTAGSGLSDIRRRVSLHGFDALADTDPSTFPMHRNQVPSVSASQKKRRASRAMLEDFNALRASRIIPEDFNAFASLDTSTAFALLNRAQAQSGSRRGSVRRSSIEDLKAAFLNPSCPFAPFTPINRTQNASGTNSRRASRIGLEELDVLANFDPTTAFMTNRAQPLTNSRRASKVGLDDLINLSTLGLPSEYIHTNQGQPASASRRASKVGLDDLINLSTLGLPSEYTHTNQGQPTSASRRSSKQSFEVCDGLGDFDSLSGFSSPVRGPNTSNSRRASKMSLEGFDALAEFEPAAAFASFSRAQTASNSRRASKMSLDSFDVFAEFEPATVSSSLNRSQTAANSRRASKMSLEGFDAFAAFDPLTAFSRINKTQAPSNSRRASKVGLEDLNSGNASDAPAAGTSVYQAQATSSSRRTSRVSLEGFDMLTAFDSSASFTPICRAPEGYGSRRSSKVTLEDYNALLGYDESADAQINQTLDTSASRRASRVCFEGLGSLPALDESPSSTPVNRTRDEPSKRAPIQRAPAQRKSFTFDFINLSPPESPEALKSQNGGYAFGFENFPGLSETAWNAPSRAQRERETGGVTPILNHLQTGLQISSPYNRAARSPCNKAAASKQSTEGGGSKRPSDDKKYRTCEKEGCPTTRHFGFDGEKARFCFYHKEEGMTNLSLRKCLECHRTASFGLLSTKVKEFCSEHKKEGHINLSLKRCTIEGCDKTANYGFHKEALQFCGIHKLEGMELRRTWRKMEKQSKDT